MAKKISQLTQATEVKSDDVTVIVQDGETKKLPLNMMVTKQDIENKKVAGLAKLDEIEATYENDTYTPTITVKNKSSVKTGEGDEVDYSANVMDGHAKSAILKGQTLVNLCKNPIITVTSGGGRQWITSRWTLEANKKYMSVFYVESNTLDNAIKDIFTIIDSNGSTTSYWGTTVIPAGKNGIFKKTFSLTSPIKNYGLYSDNSTTGNAVVKCILLEYQEGMENWDIPYFEGMTSAKAPVLKSVGKNLLNPSWKQEYGKFYPFKLKKGTTLTLSTKDSIPSLGGNLLFTTISGREKWFSIDEGATKNTITLDEDVYQVKYLLTGDIEYQLEIGSVATSYEPYKTNILSTPSDLELRGIGDVKDELNYLTGEVTERIGEIVLDGSLQAEGIYEQAGETVGFYFPLDTIQLKPADDADIPKIIICDKFKVEKHEYQWAEGKWLDEEFLSATADGRIAIRLLATKVSTIDELHQYLSQNPITVQYQFATESVKTVDLMPSGTHPSTTPYCWKNGHIQLSSSGLLPNLEYSVVTSRAGQINQNATMIVKNDKRIFDLEILLAGGLVNTTYQALTLQNQVETGLSKVSLNSETEPDYLLYHMIMKLIEEKAYKLDDLTEKVSVFYLYEKLSDEQFEAIYSELYPFVEEEIVEEPVVEELPEVVEDEVIM